MVKQRYLWGQRLAEPGDMYMQNVSAATGWCVTPHPVKQDVGGYRTTSIDRQRGEKAALAGWSHIVAGPIRPELDRPQ